MSREAISPQIDYQINRQYLKLERKKTWKYIFIQLKLEIIFLFKKETRATKKKKKKKNMAFLVTI